MSDVDESEHTPIVRQDTEWIMESFENQAATRSDLDKADPAKKHSKYKPSDDGERGPLVRPGFGAKITYIPYEGFPSAVEDWAAATLTWTELAMLWFVEQITNKPEWHVKVFNDEIVAKWKTEALAVDWAAVDLKHAHFVDDTFEYCLKELREKAKLYEATGLVPVFDASVAVIKSDCAVPSDLKRELKNAVATLENVPDHQRDWHPGSDEKVLDLVHPSLWPLAYGVSRIVPDARISLENTLKSCGTGRILPSPTPLKEDDGRLWSAKYQWLPCDVDLDRNGNARIASYINNLHPTRHTALYKAIEKIIAKALPLWDVVYKWPEHFAHQRIHCSSALPQCLTPEICHEKGFCDPENRPREPNEGANDEDSGLNGDGVSADLNADDTDFPPASEIARRDQAWFEATHGVEKPKVPEYRPMTLQAKHVKLNGGFFDNAERIQVIVKLANIHLTPEKPTYDGGSWHIEGQLNEHICATALYYYDNDNIADSRLAFRTTANSEDLTVELDYEQEDRHSIGCLFKIDPSSDTLQDLGSVLTREDRLLAFPNVYQHRVAPFELADKTRPGHRKIVALFLVDPAIPIIGTANVPPQQQHWWRDEVDMGKLMLPPELVDMITDEMDFPIGLERAKQMRLEVMDERRAIGESSMARIRDAEWNFCEH